MKITIGKPISREELERWLLKRGSRVLGGEEASCRAPSSSVCHRSDTDGPGTINLWVGHSMHSDGTGNQVVFVT